MSEEIKEDEVMNTFTSDEFDDMVKAFGEGMDASIEEVAPKQVRYVTILLCEHLEKVQLVTNAPKKLAARMLKEIAKDVDKDLAKEEASSIILTH